MCPSTYVPSNLGHWLVKYACRQLIPWVGEMKIKALPPNLDSHWHQWDRVPAQRLPCLIPTLLPKLSQHALGNGPSQLPLQHLSWEAKQRQFSKGRALGPSVFLLASSIIIVNMQSVTEHSLCGQHRFGHTYVLTHLFLTITLLGTDIIFISHMRELRYRIK